MDANKLYLGDNLEILKSIKNDTVDLVYLDPPFFSNRNYEVIWGDEGEKRSFQDRWAGGINHYIEWLKERVEEMYRVLKPTGSIFLHCDYHANAYIRVYILDKIFGQNHFVNEIIWCYSIGGKSKKAFGKKHDIIYYYTKSKEYIFNKDGATIKRKPNSHMKTKIDKEGRIYQEKIDKKSEKIYIYYLDEGKIAEDYWTDIETLNREDKERIGYPTQKPEKLLERIIKTSSNKGDVVLDPFMGGGTTIAISDKLGRKWIGIDQSPMAVKVTDFRLQKQTDLLTIPYTVQLYKYDYDTIKNKDAFEFESWIIQQFGGISNVKQRSDLGIDGKTENGTPIQVKQSEDIGRNVIDNFLSAIQRYDKNLFNKNKKEKKAVGYIIAFSFGKGTVEETARLKTEDGIIINLVEVKDIIPISTKPSITVSVKELTRDDKGNREIGFTAKGDSKAGIEFYSWDFEHDKEKGFKATVIMDKTGKQTKTFNTGTHMIAVKVVDNDGLENIEVFTLQLNGVMKKTRTNT
jgi:DNA modification methylase